MHIIFDPLSLKFAPVEPGVSAYASNFVLMPLSVVHASVVPIVNALAVLLTFDVISIVD